MSKHRQHDPQGNPPEPQPTDPAGRAVDPAGKHPVPEELGLPVGAKSPKTVVDPADRADLKEMPDELAREQAHAAEPDPKVAKLQPRPKDPEGPDPGPPTPPAADPGGPIPRLIHDNERSPDPAQFQRYKLRAINYADQPQRYVLAKKGDLEGAKQKYVEAVGLQAVLDALGEGADRPRLSVRELSD